MKTYYNFFVTQRGQEEIYIFNPECKFVKLNKNRCRIIYENKSYSLLEKIQIKEKKNPILKIKLICYGNIPKRHETKLKKNNWSQTNKMEKIFNKDDFYLDFLFYDSFQLVYRIVYQIDEFETKIKIFGEQFVKNNKYKCLIFYKGEIFPLKEFFSFKDFKIIIGDKLEIKLIELADIYNKSHMFHDCNSLFEFSLLEEKGNEIIDYSAKEEKSDINLQYSNSSQETYLNCKKINTEINRIDLSSDISSSSFQTFKSFLSMASESKKLKFTIKLTDISFMFAGCSSLDFLPDISDWNTENMTNMSHLFYECKSLISLPDISKWKTGNVEDMSHMFGECPSLISLPDISKWNTHNVENMNSMFGYNLESKIAPIAPPKKTNNIKKNNKGHLIKIRDYYYLYLIYQNGILKV